MLPLQGSPGISLAMEGTQEVLTWGQPRDGTGSCFAAVGCVWRCRLCLWLLRCSSACLVLRKTDGTQPGSVTLAVCSSVHWDQGTQGKSKASQGQQYGESLPCPGLPGCLCSTPPPVSPTKMPHGEIVYAGKTAALTGRKQCLEEIAVVLWACQAFLPSPPASSSPSILAGAQT